MLHKDNVSTGFAQEAQDQQQQRLLTTSMQASNDLWKLEGMLAYNALSSRTGQKVG